MSEGMAWSLVVAMVVGVLVRTYLMSPSRNPDAKAVSPGVLGWLLLVVVLCALGFWWAMRG